MTAHLTTTWFKTQYEARYDLERLLEAYKASAEEAGVLLDVHELDPIQQNHRETFCDENTAKLKHWCALVEHASVPMVLTDADMMVVNDPARGFDEGDWDVALTQRRPKGAHKWINGGVVFVRPTEGAKQFMRVWRDVNDEFMRNRREHKRWKRKYAGINQAAVGKVIDSGLIPETCKLGMLPCWKYNCCDNVLGRYDPEETKLVHVKGVLRSAVFREKPIPTSLAPIVELWDQFDPDRVVA